MKPTPIYDKYPRIPRYRTPIVVQIINWTSAVALGFVLGCLAALGF